MAVMSVKLLLAFIGFLTYAVGPCEGACSKSMLDECYASLPLPSSMLPYTPLLRIAHKLPASTSTGLAAVMFAVPKGHMINMTCGVFHGLHGCALPIQRQCSPQLSRQYNHFREAYSEMCSMIGRINHHHSWQCLANSTTLDAKVHGCLSAFRDSTVDVRSSNVSSARNRLTLCSARFALKQCNMAAVDSVCGQYSREFWLKFNYPFGSNGESQQHCDQEMRDMLMVNTTVNLVCSDGSSVIPRSYECDEEEDCFNAQDERGCEYTSSGSGASLPTPALIGIIVGLLVIIVIIVCVIKIRREVKFSKEYKRTNQNDIEVT